MNKAFLSLAALVCINAYAIPSDTLSPASFSTTLFVGQSTMITKQFSVISLPGISLNSFDDEDDVPAVFPKISLDISEVPEGVGVSFYPEYYDLFIGTELYPGEPGVGGAPYPFWVTFTGVQPGVFEFNIYGTVGGIQTATEQDTITVVAAAVPDGGSTILLMGLAALPLCFFRRKLAR